MLIDQILNNPVLEQANMLSADLRGRMSIWSAYQRGNPHLGFVHKDYEMRLSA
jgi:hypothetical protein